MIIVSRGTFLFLSGSLFHFYLQIFTFYSDSVINSHNEAACSRYILPKHSRASEDTVCHSYRKRGGVRSFFCVIKIHNWFWSSTLTDQLRKLTFIAMHGQAFVILKTDRASILIWHLHFLMTIALLDICVFCRVLSLWYW